MQCSLLCTHTTLYTQTQKSQTRVCLSVYIYDISLTLSIDVYTIYVYFCSEHPCRPLFLSLSWTDTHSRTQPCSSRALFFLAVLSPCLRLTHTHSRTQPCSSRALKYIKKEGQWEQITVARVPLPLERKKKFLVGSSWSGQDWKFKIFEKRTENFLFLIKTKKSVGLLS